MSDLQILGHLIALKHTGSFVIPGKSDTKRGQSYSYPTDTVSSVFSVYMHIDSVTVDSGDSVRQGEILGYIMNPGGGPHLHFEIRHPNAANSRNWSLVGSSSNWAVDTKGNPTGYYRNLQAMVTAGVRSPSEFIAANSRPTGAIQTNLARLAIGFSQSAGGVVISNKRLELKAGATVSLVASGLTAQGNVLVITPTWRVAGDIGRITPDGRFTVGRTAGSRGWVIVSAQGLSDSLGITILPGPLAQITISPSSVNLKSRQSQTFSATGLDASSNRVVIRPLWYTVGGIGTIDKKTGVFTAGTRTGTGYVIAYADSIFGDTGARLSGSAKVVVEDALPGAYALAQNYPNPFNPETAINYDLPEVSYVRLTVYDLAGTVVRTLVQDYHHPPGHYSVVWNGLDAEGQPAASGIYLYRLEVLDHDFVTTHKMLLIK